MKRNSTGVLVQNVGKTHHLKIRCYSYDSTVSIRHGARIAGSLRFERVGHLTQRKLSVQRPKERSREPRFCFSKSSSPHCCYTAGGEVMANPLEDSRIAGIAASIRTIPDFPKKGILFRDVTTLLLDHKAFKDTIDIFVERYKDKKIDVIVGIEARGFIFGPPIALAIGAKFVPQRKPRKLPGEVVRQEYSLEYGTDCIEMHVGAVQPGDRCVIVDDLIATGGTLAAGIKLVERVGAEVVECACLVELSDLKGRQKLSGAPLFILVDFEGE